MRQQAPPSWIDRILEWYCDEYYFEEIQGDLHEWYFAQKDQKRTFLKFRYFIQVLRYYSLTRSKSFNKLVKNPNYLSMKSILTLTYRNFKKDKLSGFVRLTNLIFGITIFMLAFVYANYELNYDTFHENGDKIYRIGQSTHNERAWAAGPIGLGPAISDNIPDVSRMTRFVPVRETWMKAGEEKLYENRVFYADSSVFSMFTYEMIKGDPRTALVDPSSIVITESMATKYFGDEDPMGKTMQMLADRGATRKVTGVIKDVPLQSHLQFDFLCSIYSYGDEEYQRSWRNYFVYTYVEIPNKTAIPKIQEEIKREFMAGYGIDDPELPFQAIVTPLQKIHLFTNQEKDNADHGNVYYVYILFSIGTFVLIISCINFINLTIIKGLDRAKEVGLRKTVGAFRTQLIWQFMSENLVLLIIAGIGSVLLLSGLSDFFRNLSGLQLPLNFLTDSQILITLAIILIGLELISGIYPAVVLSNFKPAEIIKPLGAMSMQLKKVGITRKVLIVTQFSLSIILVIGSITVYDQLSFMRNQDLGFEKEQILLVKLNYELSQKLTALKDEVNQIPGVNQLSVSASVPGYRVSMEEVQAIGNPEAEMSRIMTADHQFLNTYAIELASGENFSSTKTDQTEYLINETMASLVFGDKNPVGQFISWRDTGRVVGVVRDFNFQSLHSNVEPLTIIRHPEINYGYLSIQFNPASTTAVLDGIEQAGKAIYPDLPRIEPEFLDDRFGEHYLAESRLQTIVWFFCVITIALTLSGIFSVATYNARKRAKEIAIRKVFGAGYPEMIWQMLKGFILLLVISFLIGVPGAYYLSIWWLQDFAYHITLSPIVFIAAILIMLILVFISSGYVTSRAANRNPAVVLKNE